MHHVYVQVWFHFGDTGFFSNRVFPTDGLGTKEGWHYVYPVHEARFDSLVMTPHSCMLHACCTCKAPQIDSLQQSSLWAAEA